MPACQAGPDMTVHYSTKAYGLSFSDGLRQELNQVNVGVTLLAPRPTKTVF